MSLISSCFEKEYSEKWFKIICDNHNKGLNWKKISSSKLLSFEMVLENLHFPWKWNEIFHNKNFTIEHKTLLVNIMLETSENGKISSETIQNILDNGGWNFGKPNLNELSHNKTLTPNVVLNNLNLPWTWIGIFKNPIFTMEMMIEMPYHLLNFYYISSNPNLTIEIILMYELSNWDWKSISKNPAISEEMIMENPELPWEWKYVSENPNITIKLVKSKLSIVLDVKGKESIVIDAKGKESNDFVMEQELKNNDSTSEELFKNTETNYFPIVCSKKTCSCVKYYENDDFFSLFDWKKLSANQGIKIDDIMTTSKFPWVEDIIYTRSDIYNKKDRNFLKLEMYFSKFANEHSRNENIKIEDILNNANLKWNWKFISSRSDLLLEHILMNRFLHWDWEQLSKTLKITIEDVLNNIDLPWDYSSLTLNENIKINDVVKYMKPYVKLCEENNQILWDTVKIIPWNFDSYPLAFNYLFGNEVKIIEIKQNKILPLNVNFFSNCPAILYSFIKHFPSKVFHYELDKTLLKKFLGTNFITIEKIEENPTFPWYPTISVNPNITLDYVLKNLNKNWNLGIVTRNKNISVEDIISNLHHLKNNINMLDWDFISINALLETIENNLELPWKWDLISSNKNLTFDFIRKHFNKPWNIEKINRNKTLTSGNIITIDLSKLETYKTKFTIKDILADYSRDWNWNEITTDFFENDLKKYVRNQTKITLLTKISIKRRKLFL